jgi:RNA polymerase sigma factor (sigma-70 family)
MSILHAATLRDLSSEGLIRAALRGDDLAFAAIIDRHQVQMTRVAYVVCGDRDLAEEAVQSAWPIVWHRLDSVREPERLGAWLASVAVNEARQLARRDRRRQVVEIRVATETSARRSDPAQRVEDLDLACALERLSPDDRALLVLRYVAGLNSTELGVAFRMSASGLRRRLARLLDVLRTELRDA